MDTTANPTWIILLGAAATILIGIAVSLLHQRRQSHWRQLRFGPDYDRSVGELGREVPVAGEPGKEAIVEAAPKVLEYRADRIEIVPLAPADAAQFSQAWDSLQARFIDSPRELVVQADQSARELMSMRGYPVGDFERRAAEVAVEHPDVVAHYRAAHAIAERDKRDGIGSDERRRALVHFRVLFDELLGAADLSRRVKSAGLMGARL